MTDIASLGVEVKTDSADKGAKNLEKLAAAAMKAELAANKLKKSAADTDTALGRNAQQAQKTQAAVENLAAARARAAASKTQSAAKELAAELSLERAEARVTAERARATAAISRQVLIEERLSSVRARAATQAVRDANAQSAAQDRAATVAIRRATAEERLARMRERTANNNSRQAMRASNGFGNNNVANVAAQFQDIAVTTAMGMSPLQIALQQGTQLSAILGNQGAAGAANMLKGAFMSIISPVSLLTIGTIALGTAAFQYFSKSKTDANTLNTLLKAHEVQVDRITKVWGEAAEASQKYGQYSSGAAKFGFEMSTAELRKQLRESVPGVNENISSSTNASLEDIGGARAFRGMPMFKLITEDIQRMVEAAGNGEPDIIGLRQRLEELGNTSTNKGIRNLANDIALAIAPVEELARKLQEANIELRRLFNDVGPGGRLLSQGPTNRGDMGNLALYEQQKSVEAQRLQATLAAEAASNMARTDSERIAAARGSAAAANPVKGYAQNQAMMAAELRERSRIEAEITSTVRDRIAARTAEVAQSRLDVSLIGKSVQDATYLTEQFRMMEEIRRDAAEHGRIISDDEVKAVEAVARSLSEIAFLKARMQLGQDIAFERSQLFRSSDEQGIASRLRGTGIGMDSGIADDIRTNNKIAELRDGISGFFTDFKAGLLQGDSIGVALANSIMNAMNKQLDKFIQQGVDALTQVIAGAVGWNGTTNSGIAPLGSSLSSVASGIGGSASSVASSVGRSFSPAGVTKGGIPLAAIGAQGLSAKVAADSAGRFQGLLDDLTKAGYPISSLGEGGYSYRKVAGTNNLSKHAFGEAIDINPRQNPWRVGAKGNFSQYGVNPDELAKKNGLTWGGNWNKSDAMHFQVDKTVKSLGALDNSVQKTGQGLGALGNGMAKAGNALSQFPSAPGGGGGLGGIGGGLSSMFSGTKAFNWLSANPGGYIGLYDEGGYTGHGGKHQPAGIVHRGEYVFDADSTRRIGVGNLEAMRSAPGYARGGSVGGMGGGGGAGGTPNIYTIVNNAPEGTKTRTEKRRDSNGKMAYYTFVEFLRTAESEGEVDDIRQARTGQRPVASVRGRA